MKRREFIALIGGAAIAWPLATRAQHPTMPVIGFLNGASPAEYAPYIAAFLQGLRETSFVEGHNVAIEYRWAEGHFDRLPALAADLVRRGVAVIAATGNTLAALAAKAATQTIPIVFNVGADPVQHGLVANLARPGGNVTGFTALTIETLGKRMEMLRQLIPAASSIAFLFNAANPANGTQDIQRAAALLGWRPIMVGLDHPDELESAFERMVQQRASALLVSADTMLSSHNDQIAALAIRRAIPAIFAWSAAARAGGLMSYGPDIADAYRRVGSYVGRILKGEKPSDLPVQQPTRFELVINLKTAKALGPTVPDKLLALADEVVE
jgi:putative ABC transport system substrate-binding protein